MKRFEASTSWSADRPETLVVCCSDGRWHAHVEEFVRAEVSERADLYAVPGGPAAFDPWSSSFEQARVLEEAFRLLAKHHDLRAVWLIAHESCAYYRAKHGHLEGESMRLRQCEDLERAARVLREWHPHLTVRNIYAALEDGRVVFTELGDR
ncbi:MAG TPA: carbonic anhydrase [Phycisphaerae bacterium]|jgi:hypothetical protein